MVWRVLIAARLHPYTMLRGWWCRVLGLGYSCCVWTCGTVAGCSWLEGWLPAQRDAWLPARFEPHTTAANCQGFTDEAPITCPVFVDTCVLGKMLLWVYRSPS